MTTATCRTSRGPSAGCATRRMPTGVWWRGSITSGSEGSRGSSGGTRLSAPPSSPLMAIGAAACVRFSGSRREGSGASCASSGGGASLRPGCVFSRTKSCAMVASRVDASTSSCRPSSARPIAAAMSLPVA